MEYLKKLLENVGLEGQRIRMVNLSSAMATQFATIATEFTEDVRAVGPNPLGWHLEEEGEWSEAGDY